VSGAGARLLLDLPDVPFERAPAEVAVAFCFTEDRPLRGAAGRADWRLCGDLSALWLRGRMDGAAGRALLVPGDGRIAAERLVVLGLGPAAGFGADACERAVRDAVARVLDLRASIAVLAPPGDWTDVLPAGIGAQACLRGAVAALEGTDRALDLRLMTRPERHARMLRGLEAAAGDLAGGAVAVVLPGRERIPAVPDGPAPRASRAEIPPSPATPRP